ncbi:MAG: PAS domain S-box protein [Mizugakiibacter sp.]|uniref:PAS domain-containing sensor histidine kinase n=1 Tax=Mizugakiibacter sp. TaxID=1972610 RepID=UPI0031BC8F45|nr:PAS domain S-box protein [Xanthomonadaceae bacterium]
MDWIHASWVTIAVVNLVLAFVDLSIWFRRRRLVDRPTFALCSLSAATIAVLELRMMRVGAVEYWTRLLLWVHVPLTTLLIGLVFFVHQQFPSSRRGWIAPLIGLSLAALAANFLTGENLNFREVAALTPIHVWGASPVSAPIGEPNPWMFLGTVNAVLMIAFLVDTIVAVRLRGGSNERQRAIPVCVSIIVFLLLAYTWEAIVTSGLLSAPLLVAPPFLGISLVMAYLMGTDVLQAAESTTDLTMTRRRLRETEQQMELAASASGQGLWSWDISARDPWLSPSARALLGLAPGDGTDWTGLLQRVSPDDRERVRTELAAAMRGDGNIHIEFRIASGESGARWMLAIGKILLRPDHAPLHSYGVVLDVTDRHMAEERFRLLVEAMPAAILLVDDKGSIVFCNNQAESTFGYMGEQLIGMAIESLVPERYRAERSHLRGIFAGKPTSRPMGTGLELFALRRDGSEIAVEIGLTSIQIAQGHFTLVSISDITERKRMERDMAVQRDELAHLSRAASLSALSGSLAHELNQPLTAILSNAQAGARFLARETPDLDEVAVSLANIVDNAKRAGDVIRKLRSMLRNDRTDFVQLDINSVVRDTMLIVRSDLIDRRVEAVLDLSEELPRVKGDRVQLQQVLLNLIMNAADAMSEVARGRRLTLRTLVNGRSAVELQVADVGPGIPERDLERVFEPFVTGKRGGMGLGLSVCTMIVQAHGGKLWATRNSAGGATLHFLLPVLGYGAIT